MHALDERNIFSAYELYLSAQMYNTAHNLAILELAPDAIIRQDLELLRSLFIRFDSDGKRDKIEQWFVRGKVRFHTLWSSEFCSVLRIRFRCYWIMLIL